MPSRTLKHVEKGTSLAISWLLYSCFRLTEAEISSTTTARLFFFPLLDVQCSCIKPDHYRTCGRWRLARRRPTKCRPRASGNSAPRSAAPTESWTRAPVARGWRQLFRNRSSRKIDSRRLFLREKDFKKTISLTENRFCGKTYFIQFIPGDGFGGRSAAGGGRAGTGDAE